MFSGYLRCLHCSCEVHTCRFLLAMLSFGLLIYQIPLVLAAELHTKNVNVSTAVKLSSDQYKPFLLGQWDEELDTVYVAMDPFCSYCIKSIDNLDYLKNYNVYIFWAPILGLNSVNRANAFLQCDNPVSDDVLQAMKQRKKPVCDNENEQLKKLNTTAVKSLNVTSVPAYYLDGRRVSASRLYRRAGLQDGNGAGRQLSSTGFGARLPRGVVVDWSRYHDFKINPKQSREEVVAIVLDPQDSDSDQVIKRIASDDRYEIYVFWLDNIAPKDMFNRIVCTNLYSRSDHTVRADTCKRYIIDIPGLLERNAEFQLLMGIESEPAVFLNGHKTSFEALIK